MTRLCGWVPTKDCFYIPNQLSYSPKSSHAALVISGQVMAACKHQGPILLVEVTKGRSLSKGNSCHKFARSRPDHGTSHPLKRHAGYILANDYISFTIPEDGDNITFHQSPQRFQQNNGSFEEDTDWHLDHLLAQRHFTTSFLNNDKTAAVCQTVQQDQWTWVPADTMKYRKIGGRIYISSTKGYCTASPRKTANWKRQNIKRHIPPT